MDSVKATENFLQILDNSINDNLVKAAEKRGITVQELLIAFQGNALQKDVIRNQIKLEAIQERCDRVTKVSENNANTPISMSISN